MCVCSLCIVVVRITRRIHELTCVCMFVAVFQSQEQIEEERERVNASMLTLEDELESCREEGEEWKTQLEVTTKELHHTREESVSPSRTFFIASHRNK